MDIAQYVYNFLSFNQISWSLISECIFLMYNCTSNDLIFGAKKETGLAQRSSYILEFIEMNIKLSSFGQIDCPMSKPFWLCAPIDDTPPIHNWNGIA